MQKDFKAHCGIVKLLLLGTGQSGKSTLVKQMKLIHPVEEREERGFTENEKLDAQVAVYLNLVDTAMSLVDAVSFLTFEDLDSSDDVKLQLENAKERIQELGNIIQVYADRLISVNAGTELRSLKEKVDVMSPTEEITMAFNGLWSNKFIQIAYSRRNEFQLIDSAGYFMSSINRICAKGYLPNNQDILRARVKTTGVVRIKFSFGGNQFEMFDVGGQRTERRKWIHCFDNVTCVLFVVSIAEYDQVLEEDSTKNRMLESMQLFDDIVNNIHFQYTPFIIFFNKHDLFLEKIPKRGIKETFPDYQGALQCPNESLEFLTKTYLSLNTTEKHVRGVYPHVTTATDTEVIRMVFCSVAEMILTEIIKKVAMV